MEEEIDLRRYIEVISRHWKWIVGLAVVMAVAAFIYSSLRPDVYEAEAVVLVTEPRYQMQFDPRFVTEEGVPASRLFPILATSDSILQSVVEAYEPLPEANFTHLSQAALRGMVDASSEGDPSLVILRVISRFPQETASIANLWADVFVEQADDIYTGGDKDVAFFEEQVAEAEQTLAAAEAALIEFQAHNQSSIITEKLNSQRQTQSDYLAQQRGIAYIVQDIQGLREQLSEQPGNQTASFADTLTALLLQIKAFNAQASVPMQLQVDGSEFAAEKSLTEQIALLDELVATLQAKSLEIDQRLVELEPEILSSQKKLQELTIENDRLNRASAVAQETYLTLARKVEEARIASQEENGILRVGSYATVPTRPIGTNRLLFTVAAGIFGLMVGVVVAFAIEFRRQNGTEAQGPTD